MRFIPAFMLLAVSIPGAALAQNTDTNFATGPQYLMTTGSPLFSRPLATPTVSIPSTPLQAERPTRRLTSPPERAASQLLSRQPR